MQQLAVGMELGLEPVHDPVDPGRAPAWLLPLLDGVRGTDAVDLTHHRIPPPPGARRAAVLFLFGETADGPDVLLAERAGSLRDHAGHVAFPGGGADPVFLPER